jgi:hypothetical protein
MLGLGSRDEDGRGDVEAETVELLPAGDVLDGLVVQAAGDGVFVDGLLAGGEFAVGVGQEGDAWDLQDVEEQQFGVASGVVSKVRTSDESCSSGGECLSEGHLRRLARFEQEDVAVRVSNAERSAILHCGDSFFVQVAGGLTDVL